ncbi:MAG: UvrD-helicase domain-containing protein, partial [Actinomycetota bacterium]|nr:UvrD-helicase domain-containing protein [Actinomycetota bacterium]
MTGPNDVQPFDVCGPLPTGVTVLEASAGTGKTFTIAALAARYVADGTPLEDLLLVTFTRMATGELRNRVRDRLVSAENGLARALVGVPPPEGDEVLRLLAEADPTELRLRQRRLAAAIANFDAATILTTHGFCQHVLGGLGVSGDVERDVTFVEDLGDLVDEVVSDLYIRKFCRGANRGFELAEALRIGRTAVDNPTAPIEPRSAADDTVPAMRRRLALAVRVEVERRKRLAGVMTFDDLLTRLRDTLADHSRGEAICQGLRSRYRIALVDEFQDTDPVQWDIMRRAFGTGDATLVLIGDPKQAIYAFRGADVFAYLDAARQAGTKATLQTNWRSDQGLIDAFDVLLRGVKLGHQGIAYRSVRAAAANLEPRLIDAPVPAALRLRVVHRSAGQVDLTKYGYVSNASGRRHIAVDLAADLVGLLTSPATIETRPADGSAPTREQVRPGHAAVLVRTHRQAALVRDALDAAGVAAVINGAGSVFATRTAREWLRLLEALERPTSATRAASAALTVFLGWTAERVASAGDQAWESVHVRLHWWASVLRRRGVASLLETITLTESLPGRVLARVEGERELTDLRHIGQLLHAVAVSEQLGVTALASWLRQRIAESSDDTDNEERSRRLESDAEAVQVLTIHRSKGSEFPVVYYPYLWEDSWIDPSALPVYHDADAGDARTIDVGGKAGPGFGRHREQHLIEQRGEDLRLAYVALTRAKHQAIVWWAGSSDSRDSPLGRLLFAQDGQGNVAARGRLKPADDDVVACFAAMAAEAGGNISVERTRPGPTPARAPVPSRAADLEASRFDRPLDSTWRRTSYSAITSGAHDPRVTSEPERDVLADEITPPRAPFAAAAAEDLARAGPGDEEGRLRAVGSCLAAMPAGREVGTLIHTVLETTDFTSANLDGELRLRVDRERARSHLELGDPAAVVAGLRAAIETPLGGTLGDLRLRDIGPADRINEMDFELPLVGGDTPSAEL